MLTVAAPWLPEMKVAAALGSGGGRPLRSGGPGARGRSPEGTARRGELDGVLGVDSRVLDRRGGAAGGAAAERTFGSSSNSTMHCEKKSNKVLRGCAWRRGRRWEGSGA